MEFEVTADRQRIAALLRRDTAAHVYALADLDEFFEAMTTWYVARQGDEFTAVALLLDTPQVPLLYAIAPADDAAHLALLRWLSSTLPERIFATLGVGLDAALADDFVRTHDGAFVKYILSGWTKVEGLDTSRVERLGPDDWDQLVDFYENDAYLEDERDHRVLEPYMLERWPYAGIREDGRLVCAGGTHVASPTFGVAAIGNLATRPDRRGRGMAARVTAWLCAQLRASGVEHIGLNVRSENGPAIGCYVSLGFTPIMRYREMMLARTR